MKEKSKFRKVLITILILFAGTFFYFSKTSPVQIMQESEQSVKKTPILEMPTNMKKNAVVVEPVKSKKIIQDSVISNVRSQLKMNLASLYAGEISFKSEHGRYSTDLIFIGWTPKREKMNYKMGFLTEYRSSDLAVSDGQQEDPSRLNTDMFINQFLDNSKTPVAYTQLASSIILEDYRRFCENGCMAHKNSFEMIIVAKFENDQEDVWLVNQDKNIIHVKDGITGKELTKPYNKK